MDAVSCPGCRERDRRIAELGRMVARLQAEGAVLKRQLEEAVRAGKRQAAPFSKGPPKPEPKKPGASLGKTMERRHIASRLRPTR